MSAPIKEGGPAFPRTGYEFSRQENSQSDTMPQDGMTLRDWFAGQALAGILANGTLTNCSSAKAAASYAIKCADAMIEAREGGK